MLSKRQLVYTDLVYFEFEVKEFEILVSLIFTQKYTVPIKQN